MTDSIQIHMLTERKMVAPSVTSLYSEWGILSHDLSQGC